LLTAGSSIVLTNTG